MAIFGRNLRFFCIFAALFKKQPIAIAYEFGD